MSTTTALFYLLATVGLAAVLVRYAYLAFRLALNVELLVAQLVKLVHAGNADRAIKLCGVLPHHPFTRGAKAMITAAGSGRVDDRRLRRAFEDEAMAALSRDPGHDHGRSEGEDMALKQAVGRFGSLALVGVVLGMAAAGLALTGSGGEAPWSYVLPGAIGVLFAGGVVKAAHLVRRFRAGRDLLARELAQEMKRNER
jgi:hypothetical protein